MKFSLSNYFASKYPNEKKLSDTKGYKWSGVVIRSVQLMLIVSSALSLLSLIAFYEFADWNFKGTFIEDLVGKTMWLQLGFMFLLVFYIGGRALTWLSIKEQEYMGKIMQYIIDRYLKNYYKKHRADPPIFHKMNNVQEKSTKWMNNRGKITKKVITWSIPIFFILLQVIPRIQIFFPVMQQALIDNSTAVTGIIKSPFG